MRSPAVTSVAPQGTHVQDHARTKPQQGSGAGIVCTQTDTFIAVVNVRHAGPRVIGAAWGSGILISSW